MARIRVRFLGNLYNEVKLKKRMQVSRSCSVEKLIEMYYKAYGINFLIELDGGFVGLIEDGDIYYLFRDKIGIGNMYYSLHKGRVCYGTLLNEVREQIGHTEVNMQALYDFLTLLFVPGNATLYSNIFKLRAGCYVEINNSKVIEHTYYNPTKFLLNNEDVDRNLCEEYIQAKLLESLSDITLCNGSNIGLMLSDGIDSNLLAVLMNKIGCSFCAYTLCTDRNGYNDIFNERARRLNIKKIKTTSFKNINIVGMLDKLAEPYPFTDLCVISQVLGMAYDNSAFCCLSGEGADELGGYMEYIRMAKMAVALGERKHIMYENQYNGAYVSSRHISGFTETEKRRFLNMPHKFENSYRVLYEVMHEVEGKTLEDMYCKFLNLDIKLRLPELLLHRIALISRQCDVAVLFPFLSNDLLEEILKQPRTMMISGDNVKIAFKNILGRYVSVGDYYKRGFGETYSTELERQTAFLYEEFLKNDLKRQPICDIIKCGAVNDIIRKNDRKSWLIFSINNWLKVNY